MSEPQKDEARQKFEWKCPECSRTGWAWTATNAKSGLGSHYFWMHTEDGRIRRHRRMWDTGSLPGGRVR